MSDTNVFGPLVGGAHVEAAVAAAMTEWMNDYIYEIERDPILAYEPGQISRPRGIVSTSQFDKWPEDQLPVILVVSPGWSKPPTSRGRGIFDAEWRVALVPIVSDVDQPSTRILAQAYALAVRAALVQHQTLTSPTFPNGFAHYVDPVGEDYTDTSFEGSRTIMAGQIVLHVGVESVTTKWAGPRAPSETPAVDPGDWPGAQPSVTVENVGPLESLT